MFKFYFIFKNIYIILEFISYYLKKNLWIILLF
jgi:hypothetical protein